MGSKTIFGNDVSEEQLRSTFSEVGPVASVEIKFDPSTGRSKGYAFIHYFDDLTAQSAVRNLHEVHVNGRNLRVELSTDEPQRGNKRGNEGRPQGGRDTGRGGSVPQGGPGYGPPGGAAAGGPGGYGPPGGGYGGAGGPGGYGAPAGGPGAPGGYGPPGAGQGGSAGYDAPPVGGRGDFAPPPPDRVDVSLLPPGQELPSGVKATDAISKTLAAVPPGQMQEVMAGMKTLISTNPDQARTLLHQKPQLAYALFQAMLLLNIVDSSVLQRITPLPPVSTPQSHPPGPGGNFPPFAGSNAPPPPSNNYSQPPSTYPGQQSSYRPPPPAADPRDPRFAQNRAPPPAPPAAPPIPPHALAQLEMLPEDQRTMLMQVLQMTPDQISALDSNQQASVLQLVSHSVTISQVADQQRQQFLA